MDVGNEDMEVLSEEKRYTGQSRRKEDNLLWQPLKRGKNMWCLYVGSPSD